MSKIKLSITKEKEILHELEEQIYEEIGSYSLTPRKTTKRTLTFDEKKEALPKSELSFPNIIPEESLKKLYVQSVLKGQSQELVIEFAKLELETKFFNQVKEQNYIDKYNKFVDVYNLQEESPNLFIDDCLGVIRHGINVHTSKKIVNSYNHVLYKIIEEQSRYLNDIENQSNKGSAKGSKKSGNQKVVDPINFKVLHPLEIEVLKNAIDNIQLNKRKSVLVDIFERGKDGIISLDSMDKPKIHTVVICRKESVLCEDNFNFLIVDPSNSEFSEHVGLFGVNKIISSLLKRDIEIEVSNKPYKIYEQNSKIGTGLAINKFRDCIDIAFKLSKDFKKVSEQDIAFNTDDKSPMIFDNLEMNNIVKHITNNKKFDSEIKSEMCTENFLDYPFRGKQLSDDEKGVELYKKQVTLFNKISSKVNKLNIPMKNKLFAVEEMQNLLNSSLQEKELANDFLKRIDEANLLINKASSLFGDATEQEQIQLLGESLNELSQEFVDYYLQ